MLKRAVLLAVAGAVLAWPAAAQEASLDDVLNRYYEAIGGLDAWESLKSMRATGKTMMGQGIEVPLTMLAKRPRKVRIEFTFQGMTGVQAFDGETAWMLLPFMGKTEPEVMPEDMSRELEDQADMDGPLVGWKDEGNQIELVGMEETEGTQAYKLKVTLKNGDVQYYYLDSEYYVPIKIESSREMQGRTIEVETIISDYKEVDGLMIAHSIENRPKGAPAGQVITIDQVELNVDVPDSVFVMPETGEKGQQ
jgi:outer membrane lipoprotein-sorting protein